MNLKAVKQRLVAPLLLALTAAALPIGAQHPAQAAAGSPPPGECLYLTGEIRLDEDADNVRIFNPFTFQFKVMPGGQLTQQVARDPVDIALVLDDSGSMSYPMGTRPTPTRMQTLKESAASFVNMIAAAKAGDRIGMIRFNSLASTTLGLTTNYSSLRSKIDEMAAGGGTNIEDGLNVAKSMLSGGNGNAKKYIVLLTDGAATHYRDPHYDSKQRKNVDFTQDIARATELAKQRAREIKTIPIPIYTIALGQSNATDVDHSLLAYISTTTGGMKFDASNATELTNVFANIVKEIQKDGVIRHIEIRQPLPPGFELAEGNPANVSIVGDQLVILLDDISYPFTVTGFTIDVHLKQTGAVGEYTFEDAQLLYRNVCNNGQSQDKDEVLPNGHTIVVTGGWTDRWGNLYLGDGNGAVTRYKRGDMSARQFTVPGNGKLVRNMTFADTDWGDDDAIVTAEYADGSTATWNLNPAAPAIALADAKGATITDTVWHLGPGKLSLAGGARQLPANTDFAGANQDFQGGYIQGYEYRVNGGVWEPLAKGAADTLAALGENIKIEARAVTAAVSGNADQPTAGLIADSAASLDATAPTIGVTVDQHGKQWKDTNPVLSVVVTEKESPLRKVDIEIDVITLEDGKEKKITKTVSKTYAGNDKQATIPIELGQLFAGSAAGLSPTGHYQVGVRAVNAVGLEAATIQALLVNPGPSGKLVTSDGASYVTNASSKPVMVELQDVGKVIVPERDIDGVSYPAITLAAMELNVITDGKQSGWSKLGAFKFQIASAGNNKVQVRLTDSAGNSVIKELQVNIDFNQKRY